MKQRTFDEMVAYICCEISEMDVEVQYKIMMLGMVSALSMKYADDIEEAQNNRPIRENY